MIPKVIHYCWFGGNPLPELAVKCIESWKKYCPDYEIIEWNESNYDITKHPFIKKAYEYKKWAFVSDYARIDIINAHGGIYLDTDVELLSNLDRFLEYDFFAGFESEKYVAFGLGFGSVCQQPILMDILKVYDNIEFPDDNMSLFSISCPRIQTEALQRYGLVCNNQNQSLDGCQIFSSEYFCPISFDTGIMRITDKTVSIHHYNASWFSSSEKKLYKFKQKLVQTFGKKVGTKLGNFAGSNYRFFSRLKEKGVKQTVMHYMKILKERSNV